MRYFTKELWRAQSYDDDHHTVSVLLKRRNTAYQKVFSKALTKLNAKTRRFFQKVSLHDGRLQELTLSEQETRRLLSPTKATMVIRDIRGGVHHLSYSNITRFAVDFPSDKPLFYRIYDGIDDWGYDELTVAKKNLRHEILFASGATILIECATIKLLSSSRRKVQA